MKKITYLTKKNEKVKSEIKVNCHKCIHRGSIPGSAHSCCNCKKKINIKVNPIGVRISILRGWFIWPINFDPIWLKSCDGFTPNEN